MLISGSVLYAESTKGSSYLKDEFVPSGYTITWILMVQVITRWLTLLRRVLVIRTIVHCVKWNSYSSKVLWIKRDWTIWRRLHLKSVNGVSIFDVQILLLNQIYRCHQGHTKLLYDSYRPWSIAKLFTTVNYSTIKYIILTSVFSIAHSWQKWLCLKSF